ncbi:MAG: class I SAM-dependent RNA methyltransferase [Verrucomicrobia bacterium]|nr:class I SAM-dependent RNA methyltransferase [Verrucomicrobiota bacterium]
MLPFDPVQPTVAVGQKLTATIHDIAFGGEGVARVENFVVFIPFVIVGEEVEAEVTEVKKQFARAKLVRVLKPSPNRVEPQCKHYGACGGCQYQHIAYGEQLRFKQKQIADLFQRVGGFAQTVIDAAVPCPAPYGYRNRIMIRSQWNKPEQRLNIGFIRHDGGLVEDIFECAIAEPVLNEQIAHVRKNPPPKGGLKVVLRVAPEGWEVPKDSFFQNNFHQLPNLVATVRERVRDAGTKHLVDAYCGVGFFGIELARDVESFAGVEYDVMAIRAARKNLQSHAVTNGEFIQGKTEEHLASLCAKFSPDATTVVIDPPRRGCDETAIRMLRAAGPAQVIYVSCHPATLARDLNLLCEGGVYELKRVTPLDMFPQTQHVECVADVRRVG